MERYSFLDFDLIVYDFDGVMTDNKVYINESGIESVMVNRADGLGIAEIKKLKINQIILSSEKNQIVRTRAKKLNLYCLQGVDNKKKILTSYCKENKVQLEKVAYIGNDINDLDVMNLVGYRFCPSDSHRSIIEISDHVFNSKGGCGVIREFYDLIRN